MGRFRAIALVALAALLVRIVVSPAAAAEDSGRGPVHREPIAEPFVTEPDPIALDACGVEVRRERRSFAADPDILVVLLGSVLSATGRRGRGAAREHLGQLLA